MIQVFASNLAYVPPMTVAAAATKVVGDGGEGVMATGGREAGDGYASKGRDTRVWVGEASVSGEKGESGEREEGGDMGNNDS